MTRVIHTGDTHIGYQQYHRPERRQDFLDAFRRVLRDAIDDDVDAVVHAGDLFHDRRPSLTDILGTLDVLRDLAAADVPFLAVVGNHEAKRDAQWLDLFESLGLAVRLDASPHVVGNTAFYGLDFVPRSRRDALEYEFESHDVDHAALVTHGLFQPFDYGDWDAREILEGSPVEFGALLLGDNHKADRAQVADTWVTYCGSTERASADEREDRGYNIVEFDDDVSISRRGIDTREFVFVDVELAPDEGVERVREQASQYDVEGCVVVVSVDGEGERIAPAEVESALDERGALVARVTDRREFETTTEYEVSFADPDEAVRERVRELGLSSAARDIDETIRASKVADSNVADEVESRVRDIVDEADAFTRAGPSAEDTDPAVADETAADGTTDDVPDEDAPDEDTPDDDDASDEDGRTDDSVPSETPPEEATVEADGDGQSTWGDY
ncbi:DNA double-strand break repair protein Mre11 [Halomarina oriensis]|uniref:DNA double-strand break repair protein Mre11 n=1 Tax=Halomarina oriensis TaxID=671145 RepID=A0A6B0GV37_9EURY|nr:DNA double-strand break repair protein Mre11 [Halomarina oriensis]MWG36443.1 exonuclease SbcCD subunit D [Halomarina oriensis]